MAILGALLAAGTAIRIWIAFTNYGLKYDVNTLSIVARLLATHPLHAYAFERWPYPGGYFPVLLLCRWIADTTGVAFSSVLKLPSIICDAGIAALLAWPLGRFGASPRQRLVTVALVALGPSFIVISGYHGQIDAAAILPALAGVIVWKLGGEHRAWQAGALIGLAASVKQPPFFAALALLPTARSPGDRHAHWLRRAIPLLSVVPFLIDNPHQPWTSLTSNRGIPGLGGLSVLLQPGLARDLQHGYLGAWPPLTQWFYGKENWIRPRRSTFTSPYPPSAGSMCR